MTDNRYLRLRWEKVSNQRYYEVYLGRDLFGWCLTRVWGRKETSLGKIEHFPCDSYHDGEERITVIKKQREKRGYRSVLQLKFRAP